MQQSEQKEALEVLRLTAGDFDRPGIESVITIENVIDFGELKQYLEKKLAYLLEYNFEKLVNTLYLIDIDEQKLSGLFGGKNRENIPSRLADLIIERQKQKIRFRNLYKSKKDQ